MSPGIQTITQLNLPMMIKNPDYRCPVCGRMLVIAGIEECLADGRVTMAGLRLSCVSEPVSSGSAKWRKWQESHWREPADWVLIGKSVQEWFNSFFRFQRLEPEVVRRKRKTKWRRSA